MKNILLSDSEESISEYKKVMAQTVDAIADAFDSDKAYSGIEPQELKRILHQEELLPSHGIGWDATLKIAKEKILPNLLRPSSTCYMPHLHSPATIESLAAEAIISAFNQSMDSWDQGPAATEVEMEVIRHLCSLYGYEHGADGVFTSGGSQSNQTAMLLARDWFISKTMKHDVKQFGLPANFQKLRIYTSEISHFSMEKSAHILGLGHNAVVKIPVDSKKRMDIDSLSSIVRNDVKNGNIPFLAVATIGTTDFGSIDPVEKISAICNEYGMWFHADAAYGSGVVLSQKYAGRVSALNLCDSITVDFHKMFLLPISCSAVLVKDEKSFEPLTLHADYLNRKEDEEAGYTNLVDKSIQTTRRFDALKVWMSFQERGKDGWDKIITASVENALYLYNKIIKNPDFEVVTEPEISSVVFRFAGKIDESQNDQINRNARIKLLHHHGIVIGQTIEKERVFLKFTLLNPLMTHEKLDELVELLHRICNED